MAEDRKGLSGAQWTAIATIIAALLGLCGTLAGFALNCVDKTGNVYCYRPAPKLPTVMTAQPSPITDIPTFPQLPSVSAPTEIQHFTPTWTLFPGQNTPTQPDLPTNTPTNIPTNTPTITPMNTPTDFPTNTPFNKLTSFDLYTLAPKAIWASGAGPLTFGGPVNSNGYVKYEDGARLEDGTTSNKILTMHPEWVNDGLIKGLYPPYTITVEEHFRAQIGFIALSDGTCGLRSVIFGLYYLPDVGGYTRIGEWTKSCDYTLTGIDIDLSPIAGITVQFYLYVLANGSSSQDWAVWVNPRIEH